MKQSSNTKTGVIYLIFIAILIIISACYGQFLVSSIGGFKDYGALLPLMPFWMMVTVPLIIVVLYIALAIYATRAKIIKWNVKSAGFTLILVFLFIYMCLLILRSDISPLLSSEFNNVNNTPTFYERIWSIFSFLLGLTTLFAVFVLIKPVKGFKGLMTIILICLLIYALIAIGYSLLTEWDKYLNFDWFDDNYNKPYNEWISSFFTIGNVFGHTVFWGILALTCLAFMFRQYYLVLFAILLFPFVLYSNSRAAVVATVVLGILAYLYVSIRCYSHSKKLFTVLLIINVILIVALIIDSTVYNFIQFKTSEGEIVTLKDLVIKLINNWQEKRLNIIQMVPVSQDNLLFGVGYGLQFIIPRSYGYIFYFHNAIYEVIMIGGIPCLTFYVLMFLLLFYKAIKVIVLKRKYNYFGYLIVSLLPMAIYGMFESHVILMNDSSGTILGFLIVISTNTMMNYELEGYRAIEWKKIRKPHLYHLTYSYEDVFMKGSSDKGIINERAINVITRLYYELSLTSEWKYIVYANPASINVVNYSVKIDTKNKVCKITFD